MREKKTWWHRSAVVKAVLHVVGSPRQRWYKYEKIYHAFKMAKGVKRKQICALCKLRMKPNEPTSVIRSSIPGAGNGVKAGRDIEWNELITLYSGNVYTKKKDLPKDRRYILFKNGVWIDGRVNFGKNDKGRYINAPPKGKKANCRARGLPTKS